MTMTTWPFLTLTASDLMSRDVVTISEEMSLRAAARLFLENGIGGAPVVDGDGRCVGVLCATDIVRWAAEGGQGAEEVPLPDCPYQVKGRSLTGETAVICTLGEGNCLLQELRPSTGGRHVGLCRLPPGVILNRRRDTQNLAVSAVRRYMTADVVVVGPQTPLPELARAMMGSHTHRAIVVNEQRRPIGVVSSTDLVAALAYPDRERPPARSMSPPSGRNGGC
jgi:CBS domain-containing protein